MKASTPPMARPHPHLVFTLDAGMFAVQMSAVRAVLRCDDLRPPRASGPAGLRGTIGLLGTVLPVIDLSLCVGGCAADITRSSHIVAVASANGAAEHMLGILAGAVHGVHDLAPTSLRLAAANNVPLDPGWVAGRALLGDHAVLVLAANRLPLLEACGVVLAASAAGCAATHLKGAAQVLADLRTMVPFFEIVVTRLVGPLGAGSMLDAYGEDDVATLLKTMDEALANAMRALDALGSDAMVRATCTDGLAELRHALAERRLRIDRKIAMLRPPPSMRLAGLPPTRSD